MLYEWAGSEGLSLTDSVWEYLSKTRVLDHLLSTTEHLSSFGYNC